ncbi:MAG: acyl carrier protein [Oscillospiraceae bacterium]|nr:acyl carrier protein [Oscillospiraceae bacterium]
MRDSVTEKVYDILEELFMNELNRDTSGLDESLDDLGINSFNYVSLGVAIEEAFGIELTLKELDYSNRPFTTIRSLVDFIMKRAV